VVRVEAAKGWFGQTVVLIGDIKLGRAEATYGLKGLLRSHRGFVVDRGLWR
jgi:hypothetical protein